MDMARQARAGLKSSIATTNSDRPNPPRKPVTGTGTGGKFIPLGLSNSDNMLRAFLVGRGGNPLVEMKESFTKSLCGCTEPKAK